MKFQNLRKKYPRFIYEKYSFGISKNNLEIFFDFKIEPDIKFRPKVVIENIEKAKIERIGEKRLSNLVFNLGLMEIPSYWKATCSQEIIIKAGSLNKEQILWWKKLILKGMGQFFYENKIDFRKPKFLKIISFPIHRNTSLKAELLQCKDDKVLVPIGGGKDSIVTLELLKKTKKRLIPFSLNPNKIIKKVIKKSEINNSIFVEREIDSKLLELNQKGFLNGHTPFSAYLAFLSVLVAVLFNIKYIAFSNERSSNEGNVKYLGKIINHQWSKSFEFEEKFREYSKKYLAKEIEYFSFLRPLSELQIAKLFSQYPKYFPVFLSCNEAFKTASGKKRPIEKWCGNCPKCLFVFTILYPFLKESRLVKIFGQNLFNKKNLLPIMRELIGQRKFKPFECVGTKKESLIAFYLSWKKGRGVVRPFLLKYFQNKILPRDQNLEKEPQKILNSWNNHHNLPPNLDKILKDNIKIQVLSPKFINFNGF